MASWTILLLYSTFYVYSMNAAPYSTNVQTVTNVNISVEESELIVYFFSHKKVTHNTLILKIMHLAFS